ncbi:putative G-protein coupled receptor 139 [Mustelus asterias]
MDDKENCMLSQKEAYDRSRHLKTDKVLEVYSESRKELKRGIRRTKEASRVKDNPMVHYAFIRSMKVARERVDPLEDNGRKLCIEPHEVGEIFNEDFISVFTKEKVMMDVAVRERCVNTLENVDISKVFNIPFVSLQMINAIMTNCKTRLYKPRTSETKGTSPCEDRNTSSCQRLKLNTDHVNLLAIFILTRGKCGLSTCTTRYLVAMAMSDLMVIITQVILWRLSYYYFGYTFLDITPVCSVHTILFCAAIDCSVWFTVTFSFDRCVAICCQKLKSIYCTGKTAAVILATTGILLCAKNIPWYFTLEPGEIIDNVPWFCIDKPSYYSDPGWMGFDWFDMVLTPLLPFSLILLINTLTIRHILLTSRVRKRLRAQRNGEKRSDPEMESRRKSVILLFTISGSFILLWLLYVIEFLYYSISGTDPNDYNNSEYIYQQFAYMLQNLSCCTNTFIYVVTQSDFREQIKIIVTYPFTSIIQLKNKQMN